MRSKLTFSSYKSALSNYLNGDRVPRQDKIAMIADAFGIDPAWLMGYDTVPYAIGFLFVTKS